MSSLRYPSEVFIDNSKMKGVSGHLKRIEIKNSEFAGLAGNSADYVFVENIVGGVSLGDVHFAHFLNNKFKGGEVDGAKNLLIENCQTPLSYIATKVQNLMIYNCDITNLFMEEAEIGHLTWCNVNYHTQRPTDSLVYYWEGSWNKSNIREFNLYNVQISGEYPPAKGFKIGTINKDESTILPALFLQAAQKQGVLTTCPPRPNVEQLKQQALEAAPPKPLAQVQAFYSLSAGIQLPSRAVFPLI